MPFLSDRDRINLEAILESVNKIQSFIHGINNSNEFHQDEKTFDSVLMNFVVIGESVVKLSKLFRDEQSQIEWNKIKSFRNFIAHNYFGIDAEEVWQLIHSHLPKLKTDIQNILHEK
ncbi:MAG: DUF86 domain-containing protein [Bacteroidetes bacterium]|nr:DUF86 domain-containing protein [Bacteroidota bacterium]